MQINFENNHKTGFKTALLAGSHHSYFRSLAIAGKMLSADSTPVSYNLWAVAYSENHGRWADVLLGHVTTICHGTYDDTVGELYSTSNKNTESALEEQLAKYALQTVAAKIPDPITCLAVASPARAESLMNVGGEVIGGEPAAQSEAYKLAVNLMPALRNLGA